MKRLICMMLAALLAAAIFTGCSGKKEGYKSDVTVENLMSAVEKQFDASALAAVNEGYIKGKMKLDPSALGEYVVKVNTMGANINEYGIFKAESESRAGDIKKEIEAYFEFYLETWMPEYMPEELPKLKAAECRQFGSYVVYAILPDADRSAVFKEAESQLKA